jgi:thiamine pyrophosphate-dependent acetolactate synthase large subunit-like protein
MNRRDSIKIISKFVKDEPIISANGFISRELFQTYEKNSNFYMIGSMGLASSIGLGVALKNPKKRIYVFDGDGNILMNLGSLTTIGTLKPKNLVHVIFDNNSHESTGSQPTNSKKINIDKIAKSSNYQVFTVSNEKNLEKILKKIKLINGPIFLKIKITAKQKIGMRINIMPIEIKNKFVKSLIKN